MFTNSEQTAKLIELGFEKPKTKLPFEVANDELGYTYSIGELIEMMPKVIKCYYQLNLLSTSQGWCALYGMIGDGDMWSIEYESYKCELVDALYDMVLQLKEEGVI